MDLADALTGLDAHPWASVSHAYGPAEDLPDLLRALAEGDGDAGDAGEAISELYSCILHQGTVYPASVDAVPYLARIVAAAPPGTAEVLCLLGGLAESDDEWEIAPGAVRAAVAAQIPLLIPLLAHEDVNVRLLTAWTLGHTGDTEAAPVALRSRWTAEADPGVRAELLIALGRVDSSGAAVETLALLDADTPAPVRLAALLVALAAGEPWTDAHHDATLGLLPAREFAVDRYSMHHREPLHTIVDSLLGRKIEADHEAAFALLDAALRDGRPEVRTEALAAADHACHLSRSAPRRLVPALSPLAAEYPASTLLGKLGPAAAEAADALAVLAAQADDETADQALAALVRVAPQQAAPLLARELDRRPRALDAAGDFQAPAFPFDRDLLAAVRAHLAADGLGNNETADLVQLLRQWGPQAAAALPELYAVLPRFPYASTAITAVAAAAPQAEREQAGASLRAAAGSLMVARAHHDLTGETDVVLDAVAQALAACPREVGEAAQAAAALGVTAAGLLPALRAAVSQDVEPTTPQLDRDIAIATALWQIAGNAEEAVTILASVLDRTTGNHLWYRWTVVHALRAATLLGAAARPLIPRLEQLLADPEKAPAGVLALLAIADPDVVDLGQLAEAALHSAETGADISGACEALQALGATALSTHQRLRVAELAEQDQRIVVSGLANSIIREDERLRAILTAI
ncbi:HEAT repeat domain-containing protein [Streptomyces sp. NBC_00335]|uniref:HEAT repeat domain-containing protein n=1 Tax=unclassified Streptomyces TaxID=2593676 RepID=UPI00224FBA77|nr:MULTISPECIES: HEAT repeat domain-containing protein [unclassified Streptomyces]MCX5409755.1 HEAT repeat domain-containing protein [Streptomyces sp. NBC_00086]